MTPRTALSIGRILTAIENRDALGARHATLVQLDDARSALSVVLGAEPT